MEHPTFEALENFLQTGEPPEMAEHIDNCEQCRAITEGLSQVMVVAEQKGITADELMKESSERSKQQIDAHLEANANRPTRVLWPWLSAAAAIVLIFAFIWLLPGQNDLFGESTAQLAVRHQAPVTVRSATADSIWLSFGKSYKEGDYDLALSTIQKIPQSEMNWEKEFFKGLSFIYNRNPDYQLASGIFQKISEDENRFSAKAIWFNSLCLIQLKQTEAAEPLLRKIVEAGSYKAREAQVLLDLMP